MCLAIGWYHKHDSALGLARGMLGLRYWCWGIGIDARLDPKFRLDRRKATVDARLRGATPPDGHRTLATRGNVRGTGACACECMVCMYMCIWWGARASRLSSRSKTIASASSCSGAATLLLAGVPAGSETPPPKAPLRTRLEGLLLALFRNSCEWRRCDWSSWALCRASSMMTPAGLLTRSHF